MLAAELVSLATDEGRGEEGCLLTHDDESSSRAFCRRLSEVGSIVFVQKGDFLCKSSVERENGRGVGRNLIRQVRLLLFPFTLLCLPSKYQDGCWRGGGARGKVFVSLISAYRRALTFDHSPIITRATWDGETLLGLAWGMLPLSPTTLSPTPRVPPPSSIPPPPHSLILHLPPGHLSKLLLAPPPWRTGRVHPGQFLLPRTIH